MIRAVGMFGLGAIFVFISPALRGGLADDIGKVQQSIVNNSPWSYAGLGLGLLVTMMLCLYRASKPRC